MTSPSSSSPSSFTTKTLLVGSCGVGKTAFLTRHRTGEFMKKYIATKGVQNSTLKFPSTIGEIVFDIHEHSGSCMYDGGIKGDGYSACIVVFDVTSKVSFNEAIKWISLVRSKFPSILVVLCGNKDDIVGRVVRDYDIQSYIKKMVTIKYYSISAKSYYNFEFPFLSITSALFGRDTKFVERAPLLPPEVTVTDEQVAAWMEMAEASEE